jgi:general nucleoside transport system permease protein
MDSALMAEALHTGTGSEGGAFDRFVPKMLAHFHRLSGHLGGQALTFGLTIAAALIASLPIVWLAGSDLWRTAEAFFGGSLGSGPAVAETLVQMIPLLISGLAVALAFHAGLFNIGVEGQLVVGGLVAGVVGATAQLPAPLLMLVCILAGMAGGAAWALIPALLKAYRGVHEVVTTIMMNFVATSIAEFAVAPNGPFVSAGQPSATERVPAGAQLPIIWGGTRLHAGLLIAIAAIIIVLWLLYRTPAGFKLRLMGANAGAARASGISISRVTILALLGSGALGGLAGAVQVLGVYGRFFASFSPGYGFDAIAVALLGALSPIGVGAAAFFFAVLHSGSVQMQAVAGISREMVGVVSGLVVAFVAAQPSVLRLFSKWRRAGDHPQGAARAETTPFQSDAARLEDAP